MTERTIFLQALELEGGPARSTFLDDACGDDSDLRQRVEQLLQSHSDAGSFLGKPVLGSSVTSDVTPGGETETHSPDAHAGEVALDFLAPSDKPGSLGRLDHYDVMEVVGRGGMGIVLRAFDEKLHRVVALKVMAHEVTGSAAARKRFSREAKAAAAVVHDHIVPIHAIEESGPTPYLVMQFIEGHSLQQKIDEEGSLELKEILRIGMQIASGLAAAHKQGLVHRDIKPSNILLENGVQRVKITDFGLARAVDDASVSQSGIVAGTPQYMSPEQAEGQPVDHRSDLFSLGSVMYAMCTGRPPFRAASTVATLKRVCEDTPRPIRDLNPDMPEWLAGIIDTLHAKRLDERFQSAKEVAEALERGLAGVQQMTVQHASKPTDPPLAKSQPAPAIAGSLGSWSTPGWILSIAGVGAGLAWGFEWWSLLLSICGAVLLFQSGINRIRELLAPQSAIDEQPRPVSRSRSQTLIVNLGIASLVAAFVFIASIASSAPDEQSRLFLGLGVSLGLAFVALVLHGLTTPRRAEPAPDRVPTRSASGLTIFAALLVVPLIVLMVLDKFGFVADLALLWAVGLSLMGAALIVHGVRLASVRRRDRRLALASGQRADSHSWIQRWLPWIAKGAGTFCLILSATAWEEWMGGTVQLLIFADDPSIVVTLDGDETVKLYPNYSINQFDPAWPVGNWEIWVKSGTHHLRAQHGFDVVHDEHFRATPGPQKNNPGLSKKKKVYITSDALRLQGDWKAVSARYIGGPALLPEALPLTGLHVEGKRLRLRLPGMEAAFDFDVAVNESARQLRINGVAQDTFVIDRMIEYRLNGDQLRLGLVYPQPRLAADRDRGIPPGIAENQGLEIVFERIRPLDQSNSRPGGNLGGADVAELQRLVALQEKAVDRAKLRAQAGVVSGADVSVAEIDALEARIRLAEAQRNSSDVRRWLNELVRHRETLWDHAKTLHEVGRASPGDVDQAEQRVVEAKLRLAKATNPNQASLDGRWLLVSAEYQGRTIPDAEAKDMFPTELVIKGNQYSAMWRGSRHEGALEIDAAKTPAAMNFSDAVGGGQKPRMAIYQLEGDTLTLCRPVVGLNADPPRPTEFKTDPQSQNAVLTYRREG